MNASELITKLQALVDEFGDLEVSDEFGAPVNQVYYMHMHDEGEPITESPVFAIAVEV